MSVRDDLVSQLAEAVTQARDRIISDGILRVYPDFDPTDAVAIKLRCRSEINPDKTEIFFWDDKAFLKLWPMQFDMADGKLSVVHPYKIIQEVSK